MVESIVGKSSTLLTWKRDCGRGPEQIRERGQRAVAFPPPRVRARRNVDPDLCRSTARGQEIGKRLRKTFSVTRSCGQREIEAMGAE